MRLDWIPTETVDLLQIFLGPDQDKVHYSLQVEPVNTADLAPGLLERKTVRIHQHATASANTG